MFGKNLLRVVLLSVAMAAMSMAQPSSQASHTGGREKGSYYPLALGNSWLYRERGYAGQRVKITRFEWYVDSISEGHAPGYLVWPRPMEYDDVYLELLIGRRQHFRNPARNGFCSRIPFTPGSVGPPVPPTNLRRLRWFQRAGRAREADGSLAIAQSSGKLTKRPILSR
jgi:hypothetical protein